MSDSTRETLHELGDRARVIVEELARKAGERRSAAAAPSEEPVTSSAVAGIGQRLGELRACVGEVADVLEATVERLETVERQLGDPEESLERELRDSLERCERVLLGIEHRVELASAAARVDGDGGEATAHADTTLPCVLVMAPSSARRAGLCLALERQGLPVLAACDLAVALALAVRRAPDVALLDLGEWTGDAADLLDEWMEYHEQGSLPLAAVLEPAAPASARGFATLRRDHGEAALAASLARLAAAEHAQQEPE